MKQEDDILEGPKYEWIKSAFTTQVETAFGKTTLFEQVMKRVEKIQMKLKINLEDMHGIGRVIIDVQAAACEVLINLLVSCPQLFHDNINVAEGEHIANTLLETLKNQSYNTKIVE